MFRWACCKWPDLVRWIRKMVTRGANGWLNGIAISVSNWSWNQKDWILLSSPIILVEILLTYSPQKNNFFVISQWWSSLTANASGIMTGVRKTFGYSIAIGKYANLRPASIICFTAQKSEVKIHLWTCNSLVTFWKSLQEPLQRMNL